VLFLSSSTCRCRNGAKDNHMLRNKCYGRTKCRIRHTRMELFNLRTTRGGKIARDACNSIHQGNHCSATVFRPLELTFPATARLHFSATILSGNGKSLPPRRRIVFQLSALFIVREHLPSTNFQIAFHKSGFSCSNLGNLFARHIFAFSSYFTDRVVKRIAFKYPFRNNDIFTVETLTLCSESSTDRIASNLMQNRIDLFNLFTSILGSE
jgi:hypothetical protein